MRDAVRILRFLLEATARGEKTALLTITDVTGSSARGLGAQMAVSETGVFAGSLSGGCIEAAIVGEANRVIAKGRAEKLRFGQGSPFIDIRLPCGGGMDVQVSPSPDISAIRNAYGCLSARLPVVLMLGKDGSVTSRCGFDGERSGWCNEYFVALHEPDIRLFIAGNGAETIALARLAKTHGAEGVALSPNEAIVRAITSDGTEAHLLKGQRRSPHLRADGYSAVVTLFHDHDWETELLLQALEQSPFFIGAMGSRATHARRLQILAEHGATEASFARIVGPVGLIRATRDPESLALSVLSQIASCYHELFLTSPQPVM